MTELYWITVLASLSKTITALMIFFALASGILLISFFITRMDDAIGASNLIFKWLKRSSVATIASILLSIFIPSSTQLYAIYGIGGTLDYLKENKEAQKLPDNILKALNSYLEQTQKENNQNK